MRKKISPTLFALSTIALLLLASSPLLLSPFTIRVFAQTETDAGDDDDAATMASGAANDNTAAPQLQMRIQMQLQLATTTTI